MSNNLHFDLSHFAIIQISGDDATEFLENQLITHMPDLQSSGWLLSAWCLPNGRMLANFILFQNTDKYFVILPSMMKQTIIDRLKMYVLRSKVVIEDVSEHYALLGLSGDDYVELLRTHTEFIVNAKFQVINESMLLLMPGKSARWMLLIPIESVNRFMNQSLMSFAEGDRSTWSLLDIESGLPWVTKATSEQFLPQMLNLDETGGLSYQKGCYPGQEIIARIHFRGEVKKRLYVGSGNSDITPGPGDQLESTKDQKLIGDVIDAEQNPTNGFSVIAAVNISDDESIQAQLRGENNNLIELRPL